MENPNLRFRKAAVRISLNSTAILCVLVALLTLHRKMKADGHLLNSWKLYLRADKACLFIST